MRKKIINRYFFLYKLPSAESAEKRFGDCMARYIMTVPVAKGM